MMNDWLTGGFVLTEAVFSVRDRLPAGTPVKCPVHWQYKDGSEAVDVEAIVGGEPVRICEVSINKLRRDDRLARQRPEAARMQSLDTWR